MSGFVDADICESFPLTKHQFQSLSRKLLREFAAMNHRLIFIAVVRSHPVERGVIESFHQAVLLQQYEPAVSSSQEGHGVRYVEILEAAKTLIVFFSRNSERK